MHNIFVYGTLKKGYNDTFMEGSRSVLDGVTKDKFLLMDCGHPFMIPISNITSSIIKDKKTNSLKGNVKGNVITYDNTSRFEEVMRMLDRYEGYPTYFTRTTIDVEVYGEYVECMTYIPSDSTQKDILISRHIPFIEPVDNLLVWER